MPSARELMRQAFTQSGIRTLHHHRGAFYELNGACYRIIDGDTIMAIISAFLDQATRQRHRREEIHVEDVAPQVEGCVDGAQPLALLGLG